MERKRPATPETTPSERGGIADRDYRVSAVRPVPLASLRPWGRNPRTIDPGRFEELKRSLETDPAMLWARPVIARPDGEVIGGNMRLRAAGELGWPTIPTVYANIDDDTAALWGLRDNSAYGSWDEPSLAELLAELDASGVELALSGFAGREINRILAGLTDADEEDDGVPDPPSEPQSEPGEIYGLGAHRLACGDARDPELLARLLGDEEPVLVWTDPPYGVAYRGKTQRALTIANDDGGAAALLEQVLRRVDPHLTRTARFYICAPAGSGGTATRNTIAMLGWHLHESLVWVKQKLVPGFSHYAFQHEDVLYGWRAGESGHGRRGGAPWYAGGDQSSVFFVDRPARSDAHPISKPPELIEPMIRNSSRRREAVLDPFAGSGSTLIACERTGRRCFAVELDPAYCDVVRARFEESPRAR